jgi:hypothetical protein
MDGFGRCNEYDSPESSAKSATITFSSTISSTLNLAVHVAWGTVSSFLQDWVLLVYKYIDSKEYQKQILE